MSLSKGYGGTAVDAVAKDQSDSDVGVVGDVSDIESSESSTPGMPLTTTASRTKYN